MASSFPTLLSGFRELQLLLTLSGATSYTDATSSLPMSLVFLCEAFLVYVEQRSLVPVPMSA